MMAQCVVKVWTVRHIAAQQISCQDTSTSEVDVAACARVEYAVTLSDGSVLDWL